MTKRRIKRSVGRTILRLSGWALEGPVPAGRRYVLIAAPHTSNWDFVYTMAIMWSLDIRLTWMGKASLFGFPFGVLFRAMGGMPIRRDLRSNVVEQSAARFSDGRDLVLAVAAEGTRGRSTTWRSGFYHIARLADVPILPGYLDYARRCGGFGPELRLTGDVRADMDVVRDFYADKVGRHPERFTVPRLAEEDPA